MELARRALVLLLCTILICGSWTSVLSEAMLEDSEPIVECDDTFEATSTPHKDTTETGVEDSDVGESECIPETSLNDSTTDTDVDEAPESALSDSASGESAAVADPGEFDLEPELPVMQVVQTSFTMYIGETRRIDVTFSDGGTYPISYVSSAPQIVSVDGEGAVTALAPGVSIITLESDYGTEVISVSVGKQPGSVKLNSSHKLMGAPDGGMEDRLQLQVSFNPSGTTSKLRFSSSNDAIATVDEYGLVTAHKKGSVTITVRTSNKKSASVKLTVKAAPQNVELCGCTTSLGLGETGQLSAVSDPGTAGGCAFESSNPDVLEVDPATNEFTALSLGSATISVKTYNGRSASVDVTVMKAPESLTLSQSEATLGKGEYMGLPAVDLSEDCAGSVTFTSSNSRAVITADGRIRGKKVGDVTITAETYNGCSAQLLLHVVKAPSRLSLIARHKTLGVNEALTLNHRFKPGTATSRLTYESGNTAVATVNENGKVNAIAPGTVKISAKTFNKKGASIRLTVVPEPDAIDLPETLSLGLSEKYVLQPKLSPEGSGGGVYFSVDDSSVATVDELTGKITAIATGETAVRAKLYNGLEAKCRLIVCNAPTGIQLQDKNFSISAKDTYQLMPPVLESADAASGTIVYKSSAKCVRISKTGLITAIKPGKATITVSTYNKKKATLKVTVKKAPKRIIFAEDTHRLFIDHEFTPEVSFSNKTAANYSLTSSNSAIAAITEDGKSVRGIAGGTATLTATAFNGKTDTMQVWVPSLPDSVALDPAILELGAGDQAALRAMMPKGQGAELSYESSDESIASVEIVDNETIMVAAKSQGVVNITVRSQNGREATAQLAVLKAPTALSVSPSRAVRSLSEKQLQFTCGFGGADEGGRVGFSSGDESIATVDSAGLVRFVGTGTVNITAKSYNGHTTSCVLTIGNTPSQMSFEQQEVFVALGDTVQLPVKFKRGCESYTLNSADSSILTSSGDFVTALKLGATEVTAVSRSGLQASCMVRVVDAPTGIELNVTSTELIAFVGQTLQLQAKILPSGVGSMRFSSSNPVVAVVDYVTGIVTPQNAGDATIRTVTYDGRFVAECAIHVKLPLEGWRIGIDPGHQAKGNMSRESISPKGGGSKPKCTYSSSGVAHVSEHVINLQVSKKLRDTLERLGAEVYMTRETAKVDISNKQRALMMNKLHVDLVLRIHCNSWHTASPHGFSIIRRKTCAYADKDVDINQGSASTLMANEKRLANRIAAYFKKETGAKCCGNGTSDGYTMNNWSKVPCLLVELGFMTHGKEGKKLVKADYQEKMVKGLTEGICDYAGAPQPVEW